MVELVLSRMQSLRFKFQSEVDNGSTDDDVEAFIQDLLNHSEVLVKGGSMSSIGNIITRFLHYQKVSQC